MPKQQNQLFVNLELCETPVSIGSEVAETDIIDLQVTKVSACPYAVVGGNICYTATIVNNSDVDFITGEFGALEISDPLASNVEYVEGSFEYTIGSGEPVQVEPNIDVSNVMTYDIEIPAGETAVVTFCVKVLCLPE